MFSLISKVINTLKACPRVICIGDLHGDLSKTVGCLKLAKLIDKNIIYK